MRYHRGGGVSVKNTALRIQRGRGIRHALLRAGGGILNLRGGIGLPIVILSVQLNACKITVHISAAAHIPHI